MICQRILIADDDPFVRDLVRHKLGLLDYEVSVARNGVEALDRTYETHPDLIVLDMVMPEMNGLETLCHLKADPYLAEIPVLMLTALRSEKDVRGAMKLGATGYLTKPFQLDQFSERVRRILHERKTMSEPSVPIVRLSV